MNNKLIVALDTDDLKVVRQLVDKLKPLVRIFKVGAQLFTACGPAVLQLIQEKGANVFLDLKFHDIPNTVSHSVEAACRYNPLMLTVHTLGGSQMLQAAVAARNQTGAKTKILGVTILTSLDKAALEEIGLSASVNEEVLCLTQMAKACGLDGIVASPQETAILRQSLGEDFIIVTPGIRPAGPMRDDQRRTMQAKEAIAVGADYLVVGRPITQAPDPLTAVEKMLEEMQ
ncbi:MAG: orotidine-5'-phosphate decarboxylase [Candidatus Omnitrophica bacterium]|nr:orotidine-5'-phosphate decarboxylase [Candidatus Omnitrophota bacterium]